jgi:hypothetical protein
MSDTRILDWLEQRNPQITYTLKQPDGYYRTCSVVVTLGGTITRRTLRDAVIAAMEVHP